MYICIYVYICINKVRYIREGQTSNQNTKCLQTCAVSNPQNDISHKGQILGTSASLWLIGAGLWICPDPECRSVSMSPKQQYEYMGFGPIWYKPSDLQHKFGADSITKVWDC